MPKPIGMAEMSKIFEVVDALGISREVITVPLAPSGAGSVEKLPGGKFRIVIPESVPLDEWIPVLRRTLLDLGA
jgi:hypothetical protein